MINKENSPRVIEMDLPNQNWYTLDEVGARWGCTTDQLVRYAETGKLEICRMFEYACYSNIAYKDGSNYHFSKDNEEDRYVERCLLAVLKNSVRDIALLPDNKVTSIGWVHIPGDVASSGNLQILNDGGVKALFREPFEPIITCKEVIRFEETNRVHDSNMIDMDNFYEYKKPLGGYETKLLEHLFSALDRFYGVNFDPKEIDSIPKNKDVSEWLRSKGVSKRIAEVMATILRPDGLRTGPR